MRLERSGRPIPPFELYFPKEDVLAFQKYAKEILHSGMLTLGKHTVEFEKRCSSVLGCRFAVAINSGTGAIEVALRAAGIRDAEVIVPTNTFSATATAAIFAGNKVRLADIGKDSLCASYDTIEARVNSSTKAVIVVHIAGIICPDIERIAGLCESKGILLIEDAAHAFGSTYVGKSAGMFGVAGCFSFYPTKVVTSGEGGLIATDDLTIDTRARIMRDQGKESFSSNLIIELGCNWRMSEFNAAVGVLSVRRIREVVQHRNHIASIYGGILKESKTVKVIEPPKGSISNYYKYVILLDAKIDREEFKRQMRARGVSCSGEVYSPPLHLQPFFQRLLGTEKGDFPVAEDICSRMICLPMHQGISDDAAIYVAQTAGRVAESMAP